ncbi:MAG TPA: hypothetical protein VKT28_21830, partial [Puia sp.]|nr:hypothetical protein [Puia sp.]
FYVIAMNDNKMYCIPEKFRKTENLHILFWLIKDVSWAMLWRPLGIAMIFPTIFVALMITWQTRKIKAELFHNLAIVFWICANATWMLLEFTGNDEHYRKYTAIPFAIGLFFILSYYLYILPREKMREKKLAASIKAEQPIELPSIN